VLRGAGFDPDVMVSGVAEDLESDSTESLVLELAQQKARAVADRCPHALVLGCDSMLDVDGIARGKPKDVAQAMEMWQSQAGRAGTLMTGHCLIDTRQKTQSAAVARTTVHFARPDEDELAAYVDDGEPLRVAGAFTLEGRGGGFVEGVEGDPNNVMGLSLSVFRALLRDLGYRSHDLWTPS
jgi:nucleoside triphosphate pyrophosphatase